MALKIISPEIIVSELIEELGLNSSVEKIHSVKVVSALIRRTAGLLCPCPQRKIQKTILKALYGIYRPPDDFSNIIKETIELLLAHGDLLEHGDITSASSRAEVVINIAPLAFIKRKSGACIIIGIAPDDRIVLPKFLQERVQHKHITRMIPYDSSPNLSEHLKELGFIQLPYKAWSKHPLTTTPVKHIETVDRYFSSSFSQQSTYIEGLQILDPSLSNTFYPGRWVPPADKHSGRFIGRRPQAYGSDLWCYVEMEKGEPSLFFDLPLPGSMWRGCDEAWHIQAAIDAIRKNPQVYRVREESQKHIMLDLFSPIPSWVQRRWTMVGESIPRDKCLLSYRFKSEEISEEIKFVKEQIWLSDQEHV